MALPHRQKTDGPAGLGGQLQPAARGEGQRACGLGDHKGRRAGPQRFLGVAEQFGFAVDADHDKPRGIAAADRRGAEGPVFPRKVQPDRGAVARGKLPGGKPHRSGAGDFVDTSLLQGENLGHVKAGAGHGMGDRNNKRTLAGAPDEMQHPAMSGGMWQSATGPDGAVVGPEGLEPPTKAL